MYRLEKSSGLGKGAKKWKRRFLSLSSSFVLYVFEDEQETRALASIVLPSYRTQLLVAGNETASPQDNHNGGNANGGPSSSSSGGVLPAPPPPLESASSASSGAFLAFSLSHQVSSLFLSFSPSCLERVQELCSVGHEDAALWRALAARRHWLAASSDSRLEGPAARRDAHDGHTSPRPTICCCWSTTTAIITCWWP